LHVDHNHCGLLWINGLNVHRFLHVYQKGIKAGKEFDAVIGETLLI